MKRSLVIACTAFFVMTIVAKDLAALAWDLWYVVNKEYVAKALCENKAKPQLHCNGKCHLAKQLQRLEEPASDPVKHKTPAPRAFKLKETGWITSTATAMIIAEPACTPERRSHTWPESLQTLRSRPSEVFHPPSV